MAKGMFDKLFGKKEHGGCCDLEIVEESEGDNGAACDCGRREPAGVSVRVLGPGCKKCHQLHENVMEAVKLSGKTVDIEYVTDMAEIAAAGVMTTPALAVDDKIVSSGKVLKAAEIVKLL